MISVRKPSPFVRKLSPFKVQITKHDHEQKCNGQSRLQIVHNSCILMYRHCIERRKCSVFVSSTDCADYPLILASQDCRDDNVINSMFCSIRSSGTPVHCFHQPESISRGHFGVLVIIYHKYYYILFSQLVEGYHQALLFQ